MGNEMAEHNFENCGYYTDKECNIYGMGISGEDTFCRLCKDNPKCYYKQLLGLKTENIELKKRNEKIIVGYIKLSERYKQTLQDIKTIAERKIVYIDFRKSKSWAELEQDYARINYELEQKIFEILQKITKAEREEE